MMSFFMRFNVARISLVLYLFLLPAGIGLAEQTETLQVNPTKVEASQQTEKPAATPVKRPSVRRERTREEVLVLIEHAGKTKPDWWDSVPLTYPETLDLSYRDAI